MNTSLYLHSVILNSKYRGCRRCRTVSIHGLTKNTIISYKVCSCWFYRSNIKKHEILMSTMLNIVQRYKKTTTVTHNHNHSKHHLGILKRFGFASMLFGKTLRWRCLPSSLRPAAVNLYSLVYTNQSRRTYKDHMMFYCFSFAQPNSDLANRSQGIVSIWKT